ncbi:oxidoreductase [Nocardia sp. CNY236]|uniref:oxidoreductase n=1 Tax=Nocardia sp. CNY236 TaxID=1169152 RepID=UPI00041A0281|nr:oxidoreductase [Nocardia sp. CNY236]
MAWKPTEIPDQSGRTFVVTGANGGLGSVTTEVLAAKGATVIMACRNTTTAQEIAARIDGDVRVAELDLSDSTSIRKFADDCDAFDVLINNAGVMNLPFSRTKDGFEAQWGINHLGHFALTGLLLDRIADRVVTLASIAHLMAPKLRVDDLDYEHRRYLRGLAYAQAKLCNLMFARELQRRLSDSGSAKRSYAVHPGAAATDLFAHTETPLDYVTKPFIRLVGHPPAMAAHSTLFAATMPDADPDVYWGPTRFFGTQGPVGKSSSTRLSKNKRLWEQLWAQSEQRTRVTYRF